MSVVDRLRDQLHQWRVKYRRWRLIHAYAKVGRVRHGLGPGFSPLLYAYDRLTSEGLASITTDADLIWHWPDDDRDVATDGGQNSSAGETERATPINEEPPFIPNADVFDTHRRGEWIAITDTVYADVINSCWLADYHLSIVALETGNLWVHIKTGWSR